MLNLARIIAKWLILFPLSCLAEVVVILFDVVVSRYLVAACIVGVFWIPSHNLFGAGGGVFFWPTLVLGVSLCGLWEGCPIFTIREYLARFGVVASFTETRRP